MLVEEFTTLLEEHYPLSWQESWDNCGLTFGEPKAKVKKVLISLDCTLKVLEEAKKGGFDFWITHHPLFFDPFQKFDPKKEQHQIFQALLQKNIAHYSLHTNFDVAPFGTSEKMAEKLGLKGCKKLVPKPDLLSKLVVFVPKSHVLPLSKALSDLGAGKIGNYQACSFQSAGVGAFTPMAGSNPFLGKEGLEQTTEEIRLEMLLPRFHQNAVEKVLKKFHPYEEPAFDLYPLLNAHPEVGMGCFGVLPQKKSKNEFLSQLVEVFEVGNLKSNLSFSKPIQKIACVGGAGADFLPKALALGCDVLVTADCKHHQFLEAGENILLCDIGHYESESPIKKQMEQFCSRFKPEIEVFISTVEKNPISSSPFFQS